MAKVYTLALFKAPSLFLHIPSFTPSYGSCVKSGGNGKAPLRIGLNLDVPGSPLDIATPLTVSYMKNLPKVLTKSSTLKRVTSPKLLSHDPDKVPWEQIRPE